MQAFQSLKFAMLLACIGIVCQSSRALDSLTSTVCKDLGIHSNHPPKIVYLITSYDVKPVFVADFLPEDSTALVAFPGTQAGGMDCPCCISNFDDLGDNPQEFFSVWNQRSATHFPGYQSQPSSDTDVFQWRDGLRQYFRSRLWFVAQSLFFRTAGSDIIGPQYFVFLDLVNDERSIREQIALFQKQLLKELPHAAVPFHPCNALVASDNANAITSVHSTSFVAVHTNARKLLLPLDESVFSLVCNIMLRGSVMQFHVTTQVSDDATTCKLADARNLDAMMDFVSSLQTEDFILALPFSPRIQSPRKPPAFLLKNSGEYTALFSTMTCPVRCEYYYWLTHTAFACCSLANSEKSASKGYSAYNANEAYAQIAYKWQLPRVHDLACGPLTIENYVKLKLKKQDQYGDNTKLSHPLPMFSLALSAPPVILDESNACVPNSSFHRTTSSGLSSFKLTLQPDLLQLSGNTDRVVLHVQMQMTVSAPDTAAVKGDELKAIFGSIQGITIQTQCYGSQLPVTTDVNASDWRFVSATDNPFQSALAPWFYLPSADESGQRWFEVTSNTSDDSLRILNVNFSVATDCHDRMFVFANATVLLREVAPAGTSCSCRILSAETYNISFDSQDVMRRASFLVEDPPMDLYGDNDDTNRPSDEMHSDFACAGPNRAWPWGEQEETALPDTKAGAYNMCLLQNICWIDGRLTLFLPAALEGLQAENAGFFDFQSNMAVNLAPVIRADARRTMW